MANEIEWVVTIAGGIGPNVWDDEFIITADNFTEASAKALERVRTREPGDCDIISLAQKD